MTCLANVSLLLLQALCDWMKSAGAKVCAFDFPTKGILQEAARNTQYHRLRDRDGRPPGLLGWWPRRAVSFVDNHDTGGSGVQAVQACLYLEQPRHRWSRGGGCVGLSVCWTTMTQWGKETPGGVCHAQTWERIWGHAGLFGGLGVGAPFRLPCSSTKAAPIRARGLLI